MPKTLRKVQQQIKRKKGKSSSTALHEKSRDSRRLQSANLRDEKISQLAASKAKMRSPYLQRIAFFKDRVCDRPAAVTDDDMHILVKQYLARNDDDLVSVKRERRAGRPPAAKEVALERKREVERGEYKTGFWMPDVRDEEERQKLCDWDGDWVSLSVISFIRLSEDGSLQNSSFPPRGQV